ncbi:hypothetical protein KUTeg_001375, partial [Tegillarca granosa]
SIFFLRSATPKVTANDNTQKEPKTKDIVNKLYPLVDELELDTNVDKQISSFVTYDATDVESVHNLRKFNRIQNNAFIWGSRNWDSDLNLEENVYRCLPTFLKFTILCRQRKIDGFVFELSGEVFGQNIKVFNLCARHYRFYQNKALKIHNDGENIHCSSHYTHCNPGRIVETFGNGVRRVLKVLSDNDPSGVRCMDKYYVGKKGWVFEFNKWTFFITTFAPFYPESHSRYAFGCKNCYILMQPEISFALHDLPPDTPETNWDKPVTIRDRIRIAYRNAGRPYCMKDAYFNPMSWDVVKPFNKEDPILEWWKA